MFESVGWGEILVLIVVALFVLGPERLPEAASWVAKSMKKVREFATGARQQLRDEMGSDFDDLRKPLEDLRGLRNFDPKRAVTQHLFDGDPDPLGLKENGYANGNGGAKPNGFPATSTPQADPLKPGEKPPIDPDAT